MSAPRTCIWTRRQFAKTVAATAASLAAPCLSRVSAQPLLTASAVAFAGVVSGNGDGAIHTFSVRAYDDWTHLHALPSTSPGRLLLHPAMPVLYALHDVPVWDHLPRGAVSAYRFNAAAGTLTHLNTQPLSLAATHPGCAAVFLGGNGLVVEASGILNVLPLAKDGSLLPVTAIRKLLTGPPPVLTALTDQQTFAIPSGRDTQAFRLVMDEYPQILQVDFNKAMLPPLCSFEEQAGRRRLHVSLAKANPGVRGFALRAM